MANEVIEMSEENAIVEQQAIQQTQTALSTVTVNNNIPSIWSSPEAFDFAQREAKLLAAAGITPKQYQGKVSDCFIAIDIANRLGISPITVTQESQIINGNFTWKGRACRAMIDGSGLYKKTRYVMTGTKGTDSWGCYFEAIYKDGDRIVGTEVTIGMAKAEKWYDKDGSKWKTMPELMLKYRAAAFFMRTECPSLAMGFMTAEEVEDIGEAEPKTADLLKAEIEEENKNNA